MTMTLVTFIRDLYQTKDFIPLHAPQFVAREREFVLDAIDSTYVSSVGIYVDRFELALQAYTGVTRAVATVNGTAALHAALVLSGVERGDLVLTQALTFVATCNAIRQAGADPIFVDVSSRSLGLCPEALSIFLDKNAIIDDSGRCLHTATGKRIRCVLPMHTFGHPVQIDSIEELANKWNLVLIEDAAESLGSLYKNRHTGTFGRFSAISFNGNKIITTGGGGAILCKNPDDGDAAKHITTTAKLPHPYEYSHDRFGFNYRLPNINAALGCAQMEVLDSFLQRKRDLAAEYRNYFDGNNVFTFVDEPDDATSNFWLNAVLCKDFETRESLLKSTNDHGVMTRPIWTLMHKLPMYSDCIRGELSVSEDLELRIVNLPSTPRGISV
jgi:aminotransferase in exopolysaccharide biosynthesis